MAGGQGFHEHDLIAARDFGAAAAAVGVRRIIYMGGLGDPETELSQHLRSRQDTGAALARVACRSPSFAPVSSSGRVACRSNSSAI